MSENDSTPLVVWRVVLAVSGALVIAFLATSPISLQEQTAGACAVGLLVIAAYVLGRTRGELILADRPLDQLRADEPLIIPAPPGGLHSAARAARSADVEA